MRINWRTMPTRFSRSRGFGCRSSYSDTSWTMILLTLMKVYRIKEGRMQYVNLGKTGLKVSRICLGMMTYGSTKWRDWVLPEEESRPFIKRALEAGINFFDTANRYSLGNSEEILGRAIKDFARRDE